MTKREYNLHIFFKALEEERIKNKSISYKFYTASGMLNENFEHIDKNYTQLVQEEIDNIKNKITIEEEIKQEKKIINDAEEKESTSIKKFIYIIFTTYFASIILYLYLKNKKESKIRKIQNNAKEKMKQNRIYSYIYLSSK